MTRPANRWARCHDRTHVDPDKALSPPSLGHEAVSVCSILREEKKGRAAAAG
jgi:hypothetical protein